MTDGDDGGFETQAGDSDLQSWGTSMSGGVDNGRDGEGADELGGDGRQPV